jgi:hypothetical protein
MTKKERQLKEQCERLERLLEQRTREHAARVHELQDARHDRTMAEVKYDEEHTRVQQHKRTIEELLNELRFEKSRMQQALDIAENASGSVRAVTTLLDGINNIALGRGATIDNMNKEKTR